MYTKLIVFWSCIATVSADLRMSSHPRNGYGLINGGNEPFNKEADIHQRYMIPSVFRYTGLKYPGGQKYNNYDNFLRSNIDNEQDNRDFDNEKGEDHLPFRTLETKVDVSFRTNRYDGAAGRGSDLRKTIQPGASLLVPLRWNNPHAGEMEVNIWVFQQDSKIPVVIPIRKPACTAEGHQDLALKFTIPKDFTKLGSKIPGFKGCNENSKPMCTVQIYAHSVESRQYTIAFPVIIPGHEESQVTASNAGIAAETKDPWMDMSQLIDVCKPATDKDIDITTAEPRWARLISDVYNHAYQNSDFSPYSGQQQEYISKNLQASAINKMVVGNRGELGASILTSEQAGRLAKLQTLEDNIYKNYESLANKIINTLGDEFANTGELDINGKTQKLATCFRCAEVGSTRRERLTTNTYIPSFQLPSNLIQKARNIIPSKYGGLITSGGLVQIYAQSLVDLMPFFFISHPLGIIYLPAALKTTLTRKPDPANYIKRNAQGDKDGGVYASTLAKKAFAKDYNCPEECLYCDSGLKPLLKGAKATCVTGKCSGCTKLFAEYQTVAAPPVSALALQIAKSGLLKGFGRPADGGSQIVDYPDTDGSPRVGRPSNVGKKPYPKQNSTWDLSKPAPSPPTPPTPGPTPAPPVGGGPVENRGKNCWGECDSKGGLCPGYCGRLGACCRKNWSGATPVCAAVLETEYVSVPAHHECVDSTKTVPTPTVPPTTQAPARRRRGVRRRRRRSNTDAAPTRRRRRGGRRRRRRKSKKASMNMLEAALDKLDLTSVLGDVEHLPEDSCQ